MIKFLRSLILKINSNKAFTILELSISMSIISFLFALGISFFGKFNEAERYKKTLKNIEIIEKAIKVFYDANGFIPCPAPGNSFEISAAFGNSNGLFNTTSFECDMGVTTDNTGMVPVRTLQIGDDYAYDGWNRKLSYRIGKGLGSATTFNYKDSNNSYFTGDIKIVSLNGQDLTMLNSAPPNNYGAAYVIISYGANGENAAWRKNNATAPSGAVGIEAENTDHGLNKTYIQDIRTFNFDDIVAFKQKNFFTATKKGRSPYFIDSRVCTNANSLILEPLTVNASVTNLLSTQVTHTAQAIKTLCDSPPSYCIFQPNQISDLLIWLDGNDPNGNNVYPINGSTISNIYNKAGTGIDAALTSGASPVYTTSNELPKAAIMILNADTTLEIATAPQNTDYTYFVAGTFTRGSLSAPNSTSLGCPPGFKDFHAIVQDKFNYSAPFSFNSLVATLYSSVCGVFSHAMNVRSEDFYAQPVILVFNLNNTYQKDAGVNIYLYGQKNLYLHEQHGQSSASYQPNFNNTAIRGGRLLGEYIVYGKSLSDVERSKVVEYLKNRWFNNVCN